MCEGMRSEFNRMMNVFESGLDTTLDKRVGQVCKGCGNGLGLLWVWSQVQEATVAAFDKPLGQANTLRE